MNRFALIVGGAVALAGLSSQVVDAQSSKLISKAVHQGWLIQKGSPDFDNVRAFLLSQSNGYYNASDLSIDRLGDLTVQVSTHGTGVISNYDENDPPDTPPDGGNPSIGDTWSVSTCSNGLSQSWTWTYEGGTRGWVETAYSKQQGSSCNPNKNRLPPGSN